MPHRFYYAAELSEASIAPVSRFARRYGLELEDDLKGTLFQHIGNHFPLYVILTWDVRMDNQITINTMSGNTFEACWHFIEGRRGPFQRIWRN